MDTTAMLDAALGAPDQGAAAAATWRADVARVEADLVSARTQRDRLIKGYASILSDTACPGVPGINLHAAIEGRGPRDLNITGTVARAAERAAAAGGTETAAGLRQVANALSKVDDLDRRQVELNYLVGEVEAAQRRDDPILRAADPAPAAALPPSPSGPLLGLRDAAPRHQPPATIAVGLALSQWQNRAGLSASTAAAIRRVEHSQAGVFVEISGPQGGTLIDKGSGIEVQPQSGPATVIAALEAARGRGWHEVQIDGDPKAASLAWQWAAVNNGPKIVGYQPTDADQAAVTQARQRQAEKYASLKLKPAAPTAGPGLGGGR